MVDVSDEEVVEVVTCIAGSFVKEEGCSRACNFCTVLAEGYGRWSYEWVSRDGFAGTSLLRESIKAVAAIQGVDCVLAAVAG
jgi:hypothetical protein